jgi:low temperature requirement protein LtrA
LRHSVIGLAMSNAVAGGALIVGSLFDGNVRLAVWAAALLVDMAGPLFIDTSGWRLVPRHFAERHGLIIIVALGESVVAIGVGAEAGVDRGVVVAAILGIGVVFGFWWTYFDVAARAVTQRLAAMDTATNDLVRERNELARDGFSYLHLPMVAAIVLVALGLKTTLAHVHDPLPWEAATAFVGGAALYLLAHVAFELRSLRRFRTPRFAAALILLAFLPLAHRIDAVGTVAVVGAVLWGLIGFEMVRYADARHRSYDDQGAST